MALNGYRSKEDKASRLIETDWGLICLYRKSEGEYEIYKDGIRLGGVKKLAKNWIVDGTQILRRTRKDAIFESMTLFYQRARKTAA